VPATWTRNSVCEEAPSPENLSKTCRYDASSGMHSSPRTEICYSIADSHAPYCLCSPGNAASIVSSSISTINRLPDREGKSIRELQNIAPGPQRQASDCLLSSFDLLNLHFCLGHDFKGCGGANAGARLRRKRQYLANTKFGYWAEVSFGREPVDPYPSLCL
jgi:hypothetical protein